jgi:hypothetical protein
MSRDFLGCGNALKEKRGVQVARNEDGLQSKIPTPYKHWGSIDWKAQRVESELQCEKEK